MVEITSISNGPNLKLLSNAIFFKKFGLIFNSFKFRFKTAAAKGVA